MMIAKALRRARREERSPSNSMPLIQIILVQAASGKIHDAQDMADKNLKAAMDKVSAAETQLKTAQTAFDKAQAQVPFFPCAPF